MKKQAEEQGKTIEGYANGGKQTIEDLGNG